MRTFELARRLPQWLRIVLAGLLVAVALVGLVVCLVTDEIG